MAARVIRGSEEVETPQTPAEYYTALTENQFNHFVKLFLKDNICGQEWFKTLKNDDKQRLNDFFEEIPKYLIDFSNDMSKKLLTMYISTNLEYGFGHLLSEYEASILLKAIDRLVDINKHRIS